MAFEQPIENLLEGVRKAYQQDQIDKGIRASGKSSASMRKEVKPNEGTLYGVKYFFQQRFGRRPGKFPPVDDILNWIREKGIRPRDNKTTERQLAFLFARKIAQKGTDIFTKKRPALNVDEQIKELMAVFMKSVGQELKAKIKA